jgi:hypothetical protein
MDLSNGNKTKFDENKSKYLALLAEIGMSENELFNHCRQEYQL